MKSLVRDTDDLDSEVFATQTHCYTCGKKFTRVKYECPTCGEWQCSKKCREMHIKIMDNI